MTSSAPPDKRKPIEKLFKEHRYIVNNVAGYFARKCGALASHDELTQWGLIGLWDGACRWTGLPEEFHYYAYTRVKGQILDELRVKSPFSRRLAKNQRPRFTNIDDGPQLVSDTTPSDELLHAKGEISRLLKALHRLTPNERAVFVRHFIDGTPLLKLAEQMKLSSPRISQLKRRSVEKLIRGTGIKPFY